MVFKKAFYHKYFTAPRYGKNWIPHLRNTPAVCAVRYDESQLICSRFNQNLQG